MKVWYPLHKGDEQPFHHVLSCSRKKLQFKFSGGFSASPAPGRRSWLPWPSSGGRTQVYAKREPPCAPQWISTRLRSLLVDNGTADFFLVQMIPNLEGSSDVPGGYA